MQTPVRIIYGILYTVYVSIVVRFFLGTGTALMLEIARLLSIIYEDDSTRPKVTVLFALMPADGFNYLASRDWLEALEREDAVSSFKFYISRSESSF